MSIEITTVGKIPEPELELRMQPTPPKKPTAAQRRRQKIYQKYHGHCAYCGKEIEYKDMQVDHIWPKSGGGGNELENLNPACKACNFYKSAMTLEQFRDQLGLMIGRLRKDFSFRLTESYGLIRCFPKKVIFYFEKNEKT